MTNTSNRPLWNNRLASFIDATNALKSSYSTVSAPQVRLVGQAVGCLQSFVTDLFTFFQMNLGGKLAQSDRYPKDNVLSIILNQAMHDLEVLQDVAEQRLCSPSALLDGLRQADHLANNVIGRAKIGGLLGETQALAYYQKSPSIRVIPYTNLALIGIPYTALDEPHDYLAIPHEVGHFVFWHGRSAPDAPPCGSRSYLYRALADETVTTLKNLISPDRPSFDDWCYVWLEELFADVFGCWMVGPAVARTAQDVMRNHSMREFVTSDGDHPVPLVRPYIQMKALHARDLQSSGAAPWTTSADQLKADWDIEARRHTTKFDIGGGNSIDVATAMVAGCTLDTTKPVDALIDVMVKRLSKFNLTPDDWRIPPTDPADVSVLDQQLDAYLASSASAAREAVAQTETSLPCVDFRTWAFCRFDWPKTSATPDEAQEQLALKELLKDDNYQPTAPIQEAAWWQLVQGGGWTNEPDIPRWP